MDWLQGTAGVQRAHGAKPGTAGDKHSMIRRRALQEAEPRLIFAELSVGPQIGLVFMRRKNCGLLGRHLLLAENGTMAPPIFVLAIQSQSHQPGCSTRRIASPRQGNSGMRDGRARLTGQLANGPGGVGGISAASGRLARTGNTGFAGGPIL